MYKTVLLKRNYHENKHQLKKYKCCKKMFNSNDENYNYFNDRIDQMKFYNKKLRRFIIKYEYLDEFNLNDIKYMIIDLLYLIRYSVNITTSDIELLESILFYYSYDIILLLKS